MHKILREDIACMDARGENVQSLFSSLSKTEVILSNINEYTVNQMKPFGFVKSRMVSTIDHEKVYSPYGMDIWAKSEYLVRDEIEKCMVCSGSVSYIARTYEETEAMLHGIEVMGKYWSYTDIMEPQVLSGFEYFGSYERRTTKFILATIAGHIVGACAYTDGSRQEMLYIDVHVLYQNRGIATGLIQHLGKHLDSTKPLYVTQESNMGKTCSIHKKLCGFTGCRMFLCG